MQKERIIETLGDIFFILGILIFFINGRRKSKIRNEKVRIYFG